MNDADRTAFLDRLLIARNRFNWICHAYCLMENHYHLIIETPGGHLSRGMQYLNGSYTQWFNSRHGKVGHLFQGRFKSILIEKESYLLEVCRYVVLNPVRAGIISSPYEWRWSSYRATIGMDKPHPCLSITWILEQFGDELHRARAEYAGFVSEGRGIIPQARKFGRQKFLGGKEFAMILKKYGDMRSDT